MLKEGKSRHAQISDWILEEINSGRLRTDQKLPSENELSEKFDVSRVTVRRALQTLESNAVIYRSQGLGSFVGDNRSPQTLVRLTDFSEDMERAGMKAISRVLHGANEQANAKVAEMLNIEIGTYVYRIDRLRLGDNEPVAFDTTWLPFAYGQLLSNEDLQKSTIYAILESKYEIPITRGCYRMSAVNADIAIAKHLDVELNTAVMLIERTTFTLGGKPVYYQKRYYRSDKVIYEMRLEREDRSSLSGNELPLKEFVPVFYDKH